MTPKTLILLILTAVVIASVACGGSSKDSEPRRAMQVDLRQMLNEYDSNEVFAEEKYEGQLVRMRGSVSQIDSDTVTIIPYPSDQFQMSGAKCFVTTSDRNKIAGLVKQDLFSGRWGTNITIRGTHDGFSSFMITTANIKRCEINPPPEVSVGQVESFPSNSRKRAFSGGLSDTLSPKSSSMTATKAAIPTPTPREQGIERITSLITLVAEENWEQVHTYFAPEFKSFCSVEKYRNNNVETMSAFKQKLGIPEQDSLEVSIVESIVNDETAELYVAISYRNVGIIKGKPNEPREWVFQDGEWWLAPIDWDKTCLNDYSTIPMDVRYGTTGHLDQTFGEETSIEVSGDIESLGSGLVKIADLRCDGSDGCGDTMLIQPDHRIVIGIQESFRLIRLMPDGEMDESFGQGGRSKVLPFGSDKNPHIRKSLLQEDGKILLGGSSHGTGFGAARYLPSGDVDETFGEDGILTSLHDMSAVRAMDIQSNGNILFAGRRSDEEPWNLYDYTDVEHPQFTIERIGSRCNASRLIRTDQYGSIDKSFGYSGMLCPEINGRQANIFDLNVQSDDKILIVFASVDEGGYPGPTGLARYSADGHIDRSFGVNGVLETSDNNVGLITNTVAVQNDNSILITGGHSDGLGMGGRGAFVGKVLPDGSFDESFGDNGIILLADSLHYTGPVTDVSLLSTILFPDGQIVVTGQIGLGRNVWIIKFDSYGRIDTGFGTNGTVFTHRMFSLGWVYESVGVAVQGSNLILVGNHSSGYQGQSSGILIQRRVAMPETYIHPTPAPITNFVPDKIAPTPVPTPTKVPLLDDYILQEDMSFSGDRWTTQESNDCITASCLTLSNVSPGATSKMILDILHPSDFRADERLEGSTISFWVKISLPTCCESLKFMINDDLLEEWTGNLDWTFVSLPITEGRPKSLQWIYTRTNTSANDVSNTMSIRDILIR